jgi:hypothetical protein
VQLRQLLNAFGRTGLAKEGAIEKLLLEEWVAPRGGGREGG